MEVEAAETPQQPETMEEMKLLPSLPFLKASNALATPLLPPRSVEKVALDQSSHE